MDEVILSRIRKEAYEQGYQDGKVDGYNQAGKHLSTIEPQRWIPVTSRPMDKEERKEWSEQFGYALDDDEAVIYTSQLPDDGQEVIVCTKWGHVYLDTFLRDEGCYFEENGDMDGIIAWMPLPKPYEYPPKDFMNPPEGEEE